MMEVSLPSPPISGGILKSPWLTRKKFPSIYSDVSVELNLPPAPHGPCAIVPSVVQVPTKESSFCTPGPGFTDICSQAKAVMKSRKAVTANFRFTCPLLGSGFNED